MINGRNAQQAAVLNLFQSVQLNISNPHFLIMQGHIAKVLNMKPLETLSMLEEASGTRMFEAKKISALKTIEQKDVKVEDINKILADSITPKLEKLRGERTAYKEYLAAKTRVEEDSTSLAAFQYALARQEVRDSEDAELKFRISEIEAQMEEREAQVKELEKALESAKRSAHNAADIDDLEKQVAKLEKELHSLNTKKQRTEAEILSESRALAKMETQIKELESTLDAKNADLHSATAHVESSARAKQAAEAALSTLQHGFATSSDSNAANTSTVEGQLIAARQSLADHQTNLSKLERQLEIVLEDLASAEKKLERSGGSSDYNALQARHDTAKAELDALKKELRSSLQAGAEEAAIMAAYPDIADMAQKLAANAAKASAAAAAASSSSSQKGGAKRGGAKRGAAAKKSASKMDVDGGQEDEVSDLPSSTSPSTVSSASSSNDVDALISQVELRQAQIHTFVRELEMYAHSIEEEGANEAVQVESTKFRYTTPQGVKDSQVSGQVCKLVKLKSDATATALTIAGGGRWHHVVVDGQKTAEALIQHGKLARRSTFVPLDSVSAKHPNLDMAAQAQKALGAANVSHAQRLVDFEPRVEKAVSYVLGDTLICKDSTVARKVTFEHKLARSVTLDGDFFDRRGTLTGGNDASNRAPILAVLHRAHSRDEKVDKIRHDAATLRSIADETMAKKLDALVRSRQESSSLATRLASHPFHVQTSSVRKLQGERDNLQNQAIPTTQKSVKESSELVTQLESQLNSGAEAKKEANKQATAKQQKATKEANTAWRQAQQHKVHLESECEETAKELADLVREADAKREGVAKSKTYLSGALDEEMVTLTGQLTKKKAVLEREQEEAEKERKQGEEMTMRRNEARDAFSDARMEHHKLMSKQTEQKAKSKRARAVMDELTKRYPGIDRDNYAGGIVASAVASASAEGGNVSSASDHFIQQVEKLKATIAANQKKMSSLSRSINTKASAMLDSSEREYDDLQSKKRLIENDRTTILRTIQELEAKKLDTLKKTYAQVSRDFTSIFSTLLPGASAKLMPVDGSSSITEGLVVKVDFNNDYSTHLSELSGGQKSLLALSLVLALLRYNPAPMYILDEIDAALDLSHTQNIGTMLKTHFAQSQFIIVSLKEGMFNNANVLFKTRFELGISRVDRFTTIAGKAASSSSSEKKR